MVQGLSVIVGSYKARNQKLFQDSCLILANKVVMRTPVDKGSLRASWNPSLGDPVSSNVNIRRGNPIPERNKLASVIAMLSIGDKFSLTNGQSYVREIEYEGKSMQAPSGMLRRSVAEWPDIVRQAKDGL